MAFRTCDSRFPFLWSGPDQPPGRWHAEREGPCQYLSTSAKGAWAEVLRHEEIDELDDLLDLERALWEVLAPEPAVRPRLPAEVLTGGRETYVACREEARRLRAQGHRSLRAPCAALVSGLTRRFLVVEGRQLGHDEVTTETHASFGEPVELIGVPLAEGHPEPGVLDDVRAY